MTTLLGTAVALSDLDSLVSPLMAASARLRSVPRTESFSPELFIDLNIRDIVCSIRIYILLVPSLCLSIISYQPSTSTHIAHIS